MNISRPPAVENLASDLATGLAISPDAITEAIQRGLVSFKNHRGARCWRFGDARNGCLRRLDGQPFTINGQRVKAEAETKGEAWHRLIGLDDVLANDRRDILLTPEGSKDALAALHFADAEDRLSQIGIVAALGAGVKPLSDDVEQFRGRRVRVVGDADIPGQQAVFRIGKQLVAVAKEVQLIDLAGLHCENGSIVKDLFDVSRIDYDDFEANRDLWSVTDLDSKGERVSVLTREREFAFSPLPLPHGFPESHGFPVYPVSNRQELEGELANLAKRHACCVPNTAKKQRWNLVRDMAALQKRISRKFSRDELMRAFEVWHRVSLPVLDPKKKCDDYLASFLAEYGKVRVPTGEGEALKKALAHISTLSPTELPQLSGVPESWRWILALHRELARQSANGIYFLGCRDTAKAHRRLNKDSANRINRALEQLDAISLVKNGEVRPGGDASEFRYLLPL